MSEVFQARRTKAVLNMVENARILCPVLASPELSVQLKQLQAATAAHDELIAAYSPPLHPDMDNITSEVYTELYASWESILTDSGLIGDRIPGGSTWGLIALICCTTQDANYEESFAAAKNAPLFDDIAVLRMKKRQTMELTALPSELAPFETFLKNAGPPLRSPPCQILCGLMAILVKQLRKTSST